jgi:hypothetical protein
MAEKCSGNSIKEHLLTIMEKVERALLDIDWKNVYFAHVRDLKAPLTKPKKEGRVIFVASK